MLELADKASSVPSALARDIEQIAKDIENIQGMAIVRIGERLSVAQELFRHNRDEGGFRGWLESRLRMTKDTAYRLIGVYQRLGAESVAICDTLPKSVLYAISTQSTPPEVRDHVVDLASRGEKVTEVYVKELKRTYETKLAEKTDKIKELKSQKDALQSHNSRLSSDAMSKASEVSRIASDLEHAREEIRRLTEPGTITINASPAAEPAIETNTISDTSAWRTVFMQLWNSAPIEVRDWMREFTTSGVVE